MEPTTLHLAISSTIWSEQVRRVITLFLASTSTFSCRVEPGVYGYCWGIGLMPWGRNLVG